MTETDRQKRNADRLGELFPSFGARVQGVIEDLEGVGLRPRIQDGYRSPQDQLAAFNAGRSKLKFGFHNITAPDGTPEALAVDLLDDDNPLHPPTSYLLRLAYAARKRGLATGILWGLPKNLQDGVVAAIKGGKFDAKVKVGWDPTHVEPTGITVKDAQAGKRPL